MARNLQSKLSSNDSLRLFDLNTAAAQKLAQEMRAQRAGGATVEVSSSAAEAAKEAVGDNFILNCRRYAQFMVPMMRQNLTILI